MEFNHHRIRVWAVFAVLIGLGAAHADPAYTDPAKTDDDFAFQGEYAGEITTGGGKQALGVQVVAQGDGTFNVVAYPGGLPGAGWAPPAPKSAGKAARVGAGEATKVEIEGTGLCAADRKAEIRGGEIVVLGADGSRVAALPRVVRESPTLGQRPPEGAVLLYDGLGGSADTSKLARARTTDDGLLMEGATTKDAFGDATFHIEFRVPYMPADRDQRRGNGGVYVQGAYEVQVLDSFGLEAKSSECGAIYSVAAPRVNMCLPPLQWQTYDIDFTAPRFEGEKKVANARLTVRHNGMLVHEDVEVPKSTGWGPSRGLESARAALHLQQRTPVRYRNVWVLPKQ